MEQNSRSKARRKEEHTRINGGMEAWCQEQMKAQEEPPEFPVEDNCWLEEESEAEAQERMTPQERIEDELYAVRQNAAYWEARCREAEQTSEALRRQSQRRRRQRICLEYDLTMTKEGGER
jgi:hypothetical protein